VLLINLRPKIVENFLCIVNNRDFGLALYLALAVSGARDDERRHLSGGNLGAVIMAITLRPKRRSVYRICRWPYRA
jgi:hypothetical protein